MLLGLGIDLCAIARMEAAIERPRLLARVFTPGERARICAASGPRRAEMAAGLFAAKEAAAKATKARSDFFMVDNKLLN